MRTALAHRTQSLPYSCGSGADPLALSFAKFAGVARGSVVSFRFASFAACMSIGHCFRRGVQRRLRLSSPTKEDGGGMAVLSACGLPRDRSRETFGPAVGR